MIDRSLGASRLNDTRSPTASIGLDPPRDRSQQRRCISRSDGERTCRTEPAIDRHPASSAGAFGPTALPADTPSSGVRPALTASSKTRATTTFLCAGSAGNSIRAGDVVSPSRRLGSLAAMAALEAVANCYVEPSIGFDAMACECHEKPSALCEPTAFLLLELARLEIGCE